MCGCPNACLGLGYQEYWGTGCSNRLDGRRVDSHHYVGDDGDPGGLRVFVGRHCGANDRDGGTASPWMQTAETAASRRCIRTLDAHRDGRGGGRYRDGDRGRGPDPVPSGDDRGVRTHIHRRYSVAAPGSRGVSLRSERAPGAVVRSPSADEQGPRERPEEPEPQCLAIGHLHKEEERCP